MAKNIKLYLQVILIIVFGICSIILFFNLIIDPYSTYNLFVIKGFNAYKPAIYNRVRLLKSFEVLQCKPYSIILGSSRVHLGFDPQNSTWKNKIDRCYNLAFDGATTKEMYYYLRHAHCGNPLKLVLLGLDTYHPTKVPGSARPDFNPDLLLSNSGLWPQIKRIVHEIGIHISYDTFINSIKTLKSQDTNEPIWLVSNGQRLGEAFFRRPSENFSRFGPRYYFDEIDKLEIGFKMEWRIHKPKIIVYPPKIEAKDPVTSLGYIQKIIDFCRLNNIRLIIFFVPSHVHQLEIEDLTSGWASMMHGKRDLVQILAEDASRYPQRDSIPLYDFSIYSYITTEALPPEGSFEEMKYYWDSSHFKDNVGDMVLDVILQDKNFLSVPADLGVRLTKDNIDFALKKMEEDQKIYKAGHMEDIQKLRQWISEYKEKHNILDE